MSSTIKIGYKYRYEACVVIYMPPCSISSRLTYMQIGAKLFHTHNILRNRLKWLMTLIDLAGSEVKFHLGDLSMAGLTECLLAV